MPTDRAPAKAVPRYMALRLAGFYGAFFAMIGVLQPFWPVWLQSRGLGPGEIGVVMAISIGAKVFSSPLIAHAADRSGQRQRLMVAVVLVAVLSFLLFYPARSLAAIIVVSLCFFACWPPVMSLAETMTTAAARQGGVDYGRIRAAGSVCYIVVALGAGQILVGAPPDAIFALVLLALVTTAASCFAVPDVRGEANRHRLPIGRVLRERRFLLVLAACALIQGSHTVYYSFATLHWKAAGYTSDVIGALWAEGVVTEVVVFVAGAALLQRLGPSGLLLLAAGAAVVRWLGTGATTALPALLVLQSLHGFSFGAAHLGAIGFIAREIDGSIAASAQSLYAAIVWGAGLGAMSFLAGQLYKVWAGGAFTWMAGAAFAGGLFALALAVSDRRRPVERPTVSDGKEAAT